MAIGLYTVCRNSDFRGRDVHVVAPRRKYYQDVKDYCYQDRRSDGSRYRSRGIGGQGVRDRVNIKKRDTREKGVSDGSHCSTMSSNSSRGSGCTNKINHFSRRDCEAAELSSGSASDDAGTLISRISENGTENQENCVSSITTRKRKFSPIIWDKDDYKQPTVATFKTKINELEHATLPPPPPLSQGYVQSYSTHARKSVIDVLPSDAVGSVVSPQECLENSDQEVRFFDKDEEKFRPARSIIFSRWEDKINALNDEEDLPLKENLVAKRRKTTPFSDSGSHKLSQKMHTPELGEVLVGDNSGGDLSNKYDSEGELRINYGAIKVARVDYMDVGYESGVDAIDQNSDSEVEDSRSETLGRTQPPQRIINMLLCCRSVDEFEKLNKIGEGTYGVVYRAKDKKTGQIVALKKVKIEEREGFPVTSLREINLLMSIHHPSIVDVKEIVIGSSLSKVFMVMEYMEHDLKWMMGTRKQPFSQTEVKCLMLQLLSGVKYLHDNWILHRDLKTSNLLLNNHGELKICDFGMSRQYSSPLKPYTQLVVTLWYRAPELLLGAKEYSTATDMWSLGCIMAELLAKEPLFSGKSEFDQLDKIFKTLGTPNEKIWTGFSELPGVKVNFVKQPRNRLREKFPPTSFIGRPTLSEAGFDLLSKLLTYDPEKRITAEAALNHHWFREDPLPKSKDFMPTIPAQHARDRCLPRMMKSPDSLTMQRLKELKEGELGFSSLFG